MSVAYPVYEAEQQLPGVESVRAHLLTEKEVLKQCRHITVGFDFDTSGRTYRISALNAEEFIDLIDKSLERQSLNMRALLRKHNIPIPE